MCALNSLLSVWLIIGHGNVLLNLFSLVWVHIQFAHRKKNFFFVIKIPFCSYSAKNSWITYIGSEQRPQRININKKISEKMVEYFFIFYFSASLYTSYKMDFSYVSFRFLFFFCCSTFFSQNIRQELHLPWRIKICLWWMQVIRIISYFILFFNSFWNICKAQNLFISLQWENI